MEQVSIQGAMCSGNLIRIGLLSYFEGERNRYVVDDYDLLYEMSSNIKKFSRKKP